MEKACVLIKNEILHTFENLKGFLEDAIFFMKQNTKQIINKTK